MKNNIRLLISFLVISSSFQAQNLLDKLDKELAKIPQYTIGTFKTTRIALGHSVETRRKGQLEIAVFTRFWDTPNSNKTSFLSDKKTHRFSLEYGLTDRLTIGTGYTDFDGIYDGFLKYKLVRQQTGKTGTPLSITLLQSYAYRSKKLGNVTPFITGADKSAYTTQLMFAKKFNTKFSTQITPTFVHRAKSILIEDPNSQFAIGFGARHKVGKHTSIVSEYHYVTNPLKSVKTYGAFAIGVNWELSHLLLQFHITNARNFAEDTFIMQTTNNFNFHDPNLHFGFNATFVLHTEKQQL